MILALVAPVVWVAQAACPTGASSEDLLRSLSAAELAYAALNEREFYAAVDNARAQIPCLTQPLAPPDAAQVHRVEAYAAFLGGELPRAEQHFAAALSREPNYTLPISLAPAGHPLRQAFDAARQAPAAQLAPLAAPAEGSLLVDGARAADYPLNRPFLLQLQGADGTIAWTQLVGAGQALPEYERGRRGVSVDPLTGVVVPEERPWRLVGGAVLSAAAAGVLYAAAAGAEQRFLDPGDCTINTEPCYLEDQRALRVNHGLVLSSSALGLTAVGLGIGAVVRW